MKAPQTRTLAIASSVAMLLALGACDRAGEPMTGQRSDSATSKSERVAADTKRDATHASDSAGAAMDSAADKTKSMGAAAADKVDDATITTKVNAALAADKDLSALKIDVDTQNGVVTLSGPAPTATAKQRASEIAHNVKGVNSVNNQLTLQTG